MPERPRFIVIEGAIGVGKTSLARRMAESFGSELLLEESDDNPFLEKFYADRQRYALPTQLYFLFQRVRQLQDFRQGDMFEPVRVADFLLEKDPLFARLNLTDDEFRLYQQIYAQLSVDRPIPDLVIYLQAPVDVLLARIFRRAVTYERQIHGDYLEQLNEAYARFFHHYEGAPLLIVNTAEINPVDNDEDFELLLSEVRRVRSGRHYFNPTSHA
ncbi:MAG: deoxynucleoside kinase [Gammaproteobacteria bacterium]